MKKDKEDVETQVAIEVQRRAVSWYGILVVLFNLMLLRYYPVVSRIVDDHYAYEKEQGIGSFQFLPLRCLLSFYYWPLLWVIAGSIMIVFGYTRHVSRENLKGLERFLILSNIYFLLATFFFCLVPFVAYFSRLDMSHIPPPW